jgi:predicted transcriptional regulator
LEGESIASFLDPLPAQLLTKETTFADAVSVLNESATGNVLVLDEKQRLWGTLGRGDLFEIIARIAVTSAETRGDVGHLKLSNLLSPNSIYVALEDSAFVASATMLDHGISWLPVVKSKDDPRPVGLLRGEKISKHMIERIAQGQPRHPDLPARTSELKVTS